MNIHNLQIAIHHTTVPFFDAHLQGQWGISLS